MLRVFGALDNIAKETRRWLSFARSDAQVKQKQAWSAACIAKKCFCKDVTTCDQNSYSQACFHRNLKVPTSKVFSVNFLFCDGLPQNKISGITLFEVEFF